MELYHFEDGKRPHRLATGDALPATGYLWADFTRDEAADWACWAEPVVHSAIDPQHIDDSMNPLHPSFFDGTPDYDMLIFQGLGPRDERSEEHTSELQSLMRISYAVFCLKKKKQQQ